MKTDWTYCENLGPVTSVPELENVNGFTLETEDDFFFCTFNEVGDTFHMHVGCEEYDGTLEELRKIVEGFNAPSLENTFGDEDMSMGWI